MKELDVVREERQRRINDPSLGRRVDALKHYQQSRFRQTYADLLRDRRQAPACQFFLQDVYGPGDHSDRDAQFARIVPTLGRLFPDDVVATVLALARLHALSERLDTEMAEHLDSSSVTAERYAKAWQSTGQPRQRARQIELLVDVGLSLRVYTQKPLMRHVLRSMRGPAKLAGLQDLQDFLERGFALFAQLPDAAAFMATIAKRERDAAERLFSQHPANKR